MQKRLQNGQMYAISHTRTCPWLLIMYNFKQGQTGFPWIDAIMTQLREEGWIHHLARHAVACFLTRGDLWISWEEGMKVCTCAKKIVISI